MQVTVIQHIRKVTVTATTTPRQYKVVVSNAPKQRVITVAPLGKRGLRGYSAYEVAVSNGFLGTEQQWLDSLIGVSNNFQEVLHGADGIKINFALTKTPKVNSESLYLNGQKLSRTQDYAISTNIITFNTPPFSGDILEIEYYY